MTIVKITRSMWLAGLLLISTSGLYAQGGRSGGTCRNALINDAFRLATTPARAPFVTQADATNAGFSRVVPTSTGGSTIAGMYLPNGECDAGRYAGGAFNSLTDLIPLVKASMVCQDPWIAEGYYKLHLQINGHDPTVMENGRPASTQGQCNIATYQIADGTRNRDGSPHYRQDGWSTFQGLLDAINRHLSASVPTVAPVTAGARVTIANPFGDTLPIVMNQPMVIRWSYTGSTTCAQGVHFLLNNTVWGGNVPLSAGTATIDARFTNFAYPLESRIPLVLADACTQQVLSPSITARITSGSGVLRQGVVITVLGRPVAINPKGPLLTVDGQLVAEDGKIVPDPTHHYYIGANNFLNVSNLVSTNGGNVVAQGAGNVVAQGAGNVVAQGAGNVVGTGGGSVVAQGAGNIILQLAPDRIARPALTDGYLTDIWGEHILQVGARLGLRNGVLVGADGRAIVSHDGGTLINQDGAGIFGGRSSGLQAINLSSTQVQQVLSGATTLNAILNPNAVQTRLTNPTLRPGQISLNPGQVILPNGGAGPIANQGQGGQIIGLNASGALPARLITDNGGALASVNGSTLISIDHTGGLSLQSVRPYTVSRFAPASTTWANRTSVTFQWAPSGTPGNKTAIVQMQLAGRNYDVCAAVAVSLGRCQTQVVDWSSVIRASSGAGFSLVESGTRKVLATYNSPFLVRVP